MTGLIAAIDYGSGVELRVYPLYFGPIGFVAWRLGRGPSLAMVVAAVFTWAGSNYLAGLNFSHRGLWALNAGVHSASFVTVGLLISSLRQALVRERSLARTDALTGLLNSRAFYEEARHLLALCRRKRRPAAVAYLDLDGFKAINDTLGHQEGDRLLREVAACLKASTRASDLCVRLGGDEFVVLLPDVAPAEAEAALRRLHAALATTVTSSGANVGSSLGGVFYLTLPADVESMVLAADQLMYLAKAEGRNRLRLEVVSG